MAGQHAITMEKTISRLGGATHGFHLWVKQSALPVVLVGGWGLGRFKARETPNSASLRNLFILAQA